MTKLLVIFAVLVVLAVMVAAIGILLSGGEAPTLGGPTVLVWRVEGPVPEQSQPDFFGLSSPVERSSVANLYRAFHAARDDSGVAGVALYIRDTGFGLAKAQEFRRQLTALADAGKFVECYFETVGEGSNGTLAYFLATACQRIHLAPTGTVNLLGLYADSLFFRGTFDKLKIEPEFLAVGEYKSAGEQFTRSDHSPAAREAIEALVDGEYRQIVAAIAAARGLAPEVVEGLVDTAPHSADEALAAGLVDSLLYPDQFRDLVEELAGAEPRLVPVQGFGPQGPIAGRRLAVVIAEGTIVRGSGGVEPWSDELFVGSDDLAELLRRLAEDSRVPAVVLRVDSPGGSALASDLILRELELLAEEKPVVVSMSDVAASGGYYIAAKAEKIVAEPGTLTGSIGVVLGRFATAGLEREHLGITRDSIARGENAGIWRSPEPLTPPQEAEIRSEMARVYDVFVGHVADGRGMERAAVERVAEGRVWLGEDALRLGLVDELGGLDRAIELAKEAAGLAADEPLRVGFYPEPKGWLELFLEPRKPLLPAGLEALRELVAPRPTGLLELPVELRRLHAHF